MYGCLLLFVTHKKPDLHNNVLIIFIIVASSYNLRSLSFFENNRNVVISRKFGIIFIHEPKGDVYLKIIPSAMLRQVGSSTLVDNDTMSKDNNYGKKESKLSKLMSEHLMFKFSTN